MSGLSVLMPLSAVSGLSANPHISVALLLFIKFVSPKRSRG